MEQIDIIENLIHNDLKNLKANEPKRGRGRPRKNEVIENV